MDDDWGVMAPGPTFSLFKKTSPEEAAKKMSFVDIVIYNRWTRSERRLYQRLKAENIAKQVEEEKIKSIDEISDSLNAWCLWRSETQEADPKIDDLISTLENMKLKASDTKPFKISS